MGNISKFITLGLLAFSLSQGRTGLENIAKIKTTNATIEKVKPKEKSKYFEVYVHEIYHQGEFEIDIPYQRIIEKGNDRLHREKEKNQEYITLNVLDSLKRTNSTYFNKVFLKRVVNADPFYFFNTNTNAKPAVADHRFLVPFDQNASYFEVYTKSKRITQKVKL